MANAMVEGASFKYGYTNDKMGLEWGAGSRCLWLRTRFLYQIYSKNTWVWFWVFLICPKFLLKFIKSLLNKNVAPLSIVENYLIMCKVSPLCKSLDFSFFLSIRYMRVLVLVLLRNQLNYKTYRRNYLRGKAKFYVFLSLFLFLFLFCLFFIWRGEGVGRKEVGNCFC